MAACASWAGSLRQPHQTMRCHADVPTPQQRALNFYKSRCEAVPGCAVLWSGAAARRSTSAGSQPARSSEGHLCAHGTQHAVNDPGRPRTLLTACKWALLGTNDVCGSLSSYRQQACQREAYTCTVGEAREERRPRDNASTGASLVHCTAMPQAECRASTHFSSQTAPLTAKHVRHSSCRHDTLAEDTLLVTVCELDVDDHMPAHKAPQIYGVSLRSTPLLVPASMAKPTMR